MTTSELQDLDKKRGDIKRATYFKKLLKAAAPEEDSSDNTTPVLVKGRICAGDGFDVLPAPPNVTVTPPFAPRPDSYGLAVVGHSMTTPSGDGIPDGSIAIFQRGGASDGHIVHVEWGNEENRCAAIKRYVEKVDGTKLLICLNPNYQDITPWDDTFTVRGVYYGVVPNQAKVSQIEAERAAMAADTTFADAADELDKKIEREQGGGRGGKQQQKRQAA